MIFKEPRYSPLEIMSKSDEMINRVLRNQYEHLKKMEIARDKIVHDSKISSMDEAQLKILTKILNIPH